MIKKAIQIINLIVSDPEVGEKITGTVVRIMPFGAFVEIAPGKDAMIHISKLKKERVEKVEDVVKVGDKVSVEVIEVSQKGIGLKLLKVL